MCDFRNSLPSFRSAGSVASLLACALLGAPALFAQGPVSPTPVIGSSNPATAEPNVPRPSTTPCVVPLVTNQQFINYNDKPFSYAPPANCKGPWSKVVFTADFNVSAGRQFDRTAKFFLGGADIYFGTTAEPRAALSPSWHVERDITDLSALLAEPQSGVASLGNFYGVSGGVDYNGIITGSAQLEFYPVGPKDPAPKEPDAVFPLNTGGGTTTTLNASSDRLTGAFANLPKNIVGAYLELFSQSQGGDEFWYTCSPNSIANQVENCGNTGFRETDVYIDGKPAGIAPVFPWIYTGGIDPALWEPITGVQTLNFKPYLVNLTPFAGLLSDGQQHTVSMGVYNADGYFDVTGTLLLYLDHGAAQVTGAMTQNTLAATPTPSVQADAPVDSTGTTYSRALVTSTRDFTLSGYVNTSQGQVKTTINEKVQFGNYQLINLNRNLYSQDIAQLSTAYSDTSTQTGNMTQETQQTTLYPFTFDYNSTANADGSSSFVAHSYQQDFEYQKQLLNGAPTYSMGSQEEVISTDQYKLDAQGNLTTRAIDSTANYKSSDTLGHCYSRTLSSNDLKLATITDGVSCGGTNHP